MPRLHLLRVFCAADGSGGNPLGVFLDGAEVPPEQPSGRRRRPRPQRDRVRGRRERRARSASSRRRSELDFAGHPASGPRGCSRAPRRCGRPRARFAVRREGDDVYVTARPGVGTRLRARGAGLAGRGGRARRARRAGTSWSAAWAWIDATRARSARACSPCGIGIAEDEATGSAATKLCAHAGRPMEIRQGRGSRIRARPAAGGFVEIGGRSVVDDVRDYQLP